MSPFWHNFITNGRSRRQSVEVLRESLAEACEQFFVTVRDLPKTQRRALLLRELRRLTSHYREEPN